ncbi:DUF853 domain-containing protein, partial [Escherichia coli]|nr:DUF853 domain-containing protein [Escherichia coli]
ITPEQRQQLIAGSIVAGIYEKAIDRESAYEILSAEAEQKKQAEQAAIAAAEAEKQRIAEEKASRAAARNPDSFMETVGKSV